MKKYIFSFSITTAVLIIFVLSRLSDFDLSGYLSETECAQYCRKKGLYPEQISQWKQAFLQVSSPNDKAALRQSQKEVKQLKRELMRTTR